MAGATDDVVEFSAGDAAFRMTPLGVQGQLKALALVLPVLGALRKSASFAESLASLDNLDPLYSLMAASCRVRSAALPTPTKFVELASFGNLVFARKPTALLEFLAECVKSELGDFLAEDGRARLLSIGSRFGFQLKSTGESGESP